MFLSLFDDNPAVHRAFCPPRSAYTGTRKPGRRRGRCEPLDELLETGKVLALNFPVAMNPGLARDLGVMLKLDFQRAVLQRIPQMQRAAGARRGGTCCSSATSTTRLPRSARPTRPATSARSRCRGRRG